MQGVKRPFGPAGMPWVHNCSAICGASRLATAQALGGFMISAPLPAIRYLLFDALSHAVGLDRNVALGVDQLGAEGLKDRPGGVDVVFGHAEPDAEGITSLVASLG